MRTGRRERRTWWAGQLALVAAAVGGSVALATTASGQAPPDSSFEKVTLNDEPGEPMDLAVLPDGRVLHTTRPGELWMHDPKTGLNTLAAQFELYEHDEEGLQSVALDPNFKRNKWVYLYYSPPLDTPLDDPVTPRNEGDAPFEGTEADWERYRGAIRLSRFKFDGQRLRMGTEQQIIDVPVDRGICCHVGGDIVFDSNGNLILSTGDDTNPFESDGYTPIDERPERNPAFDAQRTSANTNDLRGKLLRIRVKGSGGYSIPAGNLFAPGTPNARPEIYAMGFRNPFRIEINGETDDIYVADYSPDGPTADPLRGPAGHGRWTAVREPGNYGWPYCVTPELPYRDYDFATGVSGEEFDCSAPVNESPHNTGMTELPPVVQPDVWYSYAPSAEFPELGTATGIGPMAGPAYEFERRYVSGSKAIGWPKYFDGVPLFYEWTRDYIKEFRLTPDGAVGEINPVLPTLASPTLDNGMDLEFGPQGALYALEYGDGFFSENPDAQLARIDYIGPNGNHAPQVQVSADPTRGEVPLTVQFSSEGTSDPDGDRLQYRWDFDADGRADSRRPAAEFTYDEDGVYLATLNVTDKHGRSAAQYVEILVGNQPPEVEFVTPTGEEPFAFGDLVDYEVSVTDEAAVDCDQVQVNYIVGHDEHGHPQSTTAGCTGSIQTTPIEGHDPSEITAVFVAEYTDPEGLSGSAQVVLQPGG